MWCSGITDLITTAVSCNIIRPGPLPILRYRVRVVVMRIQENAAAP